MDIQAAILDCMLIEGASLNKIMIRANVNRTAAKQVHLTRMAAEGVVKVEEVKGHRVYSATSKGIKWLKGYKNLKDLGGLGREDTDKDGRDF